MVENEWSLLDKNFTGKHLPIINLNFKLKPIFTYRRFMSKYSEILRRNPYFHYKVPYFYKSATASNLYSYDIFP
jgi:hypothetical protein